MNLLSLARRFRTGDDSQEIREALEYIIKNQEKLMATLQDLTTSIAANTTAVSDLAMAVTGVEAALGTAVPAAQLDSVKSAVDANTAAITQAASSLTAAVAPHTTP